MDQLELTWHGHSCFQVTLKGYTIVIDPYEDGAVPGLSPLNLSAHQVICSHDHHDHNASHLVSSLPKTSCPFQIKKVLTFHDSQQGSQRGNNIIHILESRNLRIAHFGDLGCSLNSQQLFALGKLDAAMIPVGGFFTINPEEAKSLLDILQPKVILPMHYRSDTFGYPQLATVDEFLELTGGGFYYPGNSISIHPCSKPHVAVLTYQG